MSCSGGEKFSFVAKRIKLTRNCNSVGDQRKKDSYDVEAAFYSAGHAERLIQAGCAVPFPLHVERSREDGLTLCMTKLVGQSASIDERRRMDRAWKIFFFFEPVMESGSPNVLPFSP